MSQTKPYLTYLPLAVALLSGCSEEAAQPFGLLNPHQVHAFELEASVDHAPGPFDSFKAEASYDVENTQCLPVMAVSGAQKIPRRDIALPITKVGDTYRARFFSDAMVDEDLYGLGPCHWRLALVSFTATKSRREFSAVVIPVGPHAQREVLTYFSNDSYAQSDTWRLDGGLRDKSGYKEPERTF